MSQPETEPSDGQQAPADSPTSPPKVIKGRTTLPVRTKKLLPVEDVNEPGIDDLERERRAFAVRLREMGMDRRIIRQLFVGKRSTGDYLRRKVAGRVQLVGFISTVDQLYKAMRVLLKVVQAKDSPNDDKIAAAECLAQLSNAKLKLGEAIIEHADACDPDASDLPPPPKETKPPVSVNFNFPPVAQGPKTAVVEIPDAKSG